MAGRLLCSKADIVYILPLISDESHVIYVDRLNLCLTERKKNGRFMRYLPKCTVSTTLETIRYHTSSKYKGSSLPGTYIGIYFCLYKAHLERIRLENSYLEEADLRGAHLEELTFPLHIYKERI